MRASEFATMPREPHVPLNIVFTPACHTLYARVPASRARHLMKLDTNPNWSAAAAGAAAGTVGIAAR